MGISDDLLKVKDNYETSGKEIRLTPCSHCKHPETKYCLMCEDCGRKFDHGVLVKEVED